MPEKKPSSLGASAMMLGLASSPEKRLLHLLCCKMAELMKKNSLSIVHIYIRVVFCRTFDNPLLQ